MKTLTSIEQMATAFFTDYRYRRLIIQILAGKKDIIKMNPRGEENHLINSQIANIINSILKTCVAKLLVVETQILP